MSSPQDDIDHIRDLAEAIYTDLAAEAGSNEWNWFPLANAAIEASEAFLQVFTNRYSPQSAVPEADAPAEATTDPSSAPTETLTETAPADPAAAATVTTTPTDPATAAAAAAAATPIPVGADPAAGVTIPVQPPPPAAPETAPASGSPPGDAPTVVSP